MTSSTSSSFDSSTPSSTFHTPVSPKIGSNAWLPASHCGSASFASKVEQCLSEINYDGLLNLCSSLHSNLTCAVLPEYSVGTQAVVRKITFSDGVEWVLRVLLDDTRAKTTQQMKDEVAIYRYLAQHTNIPVPSVHSYSADPLNVVGRTYIIFDYIHGSTISSLSDEIIAANQEHFLRQMAHIQVTLASCTFPTIGTITETLPNEFAIAAELETGKGPFATSRDYYTAVADTRYFDYAAELMKFSPPFPTTHSTEESQTRFLPLLFSSLIRTYPNSSGPFGLANMDLGFHNLLVNEKLDVVGMIDCDYVFPAPKEMVASIPKGSGIEARVPGMRPHPSEKGYREIVEQRFEIYVRLVGEEENKLGLNGLKIVDGNEEGIKEMTLAEVMVSEPARMVQGLEEYVHHDVLAMTNWMRSFHYMHVKWEKGGECAMEFDDAYWEGEEDEVEEEAGDNGEETVFWDGVDAKYYDLGFGEEEQAKEEEVAGWTHASENGGWGDWYDANGWSD